MFINPINSIQNNYSKNLTNIRFKQTIPMELKRDTVSFKASVNVNVIKANQAKIMFAQDVWTKNFNTIMPENEIQKEALLEILENLKYLQGYLKQKAKKYMILNEISRANDLTLNDPNNPELAVLNKKLDNYGNLDAVLSTLDKKIEQEEKRNRSAFEYFENLAKLQEEYLDKKLIKLPQLEKFYYKVQKQGINKEGRFSIDELIDIVKSGKQPPSEKEILLMNVEADYENFLRDRINVYSEIVTYTEDALASRVDIADKYGEELKKYPGIEKKLLEIYERVQNKFTEASRPFSNIDCISIKGLWIEMAKLEKNIKNLTKDVEQLKSDLQKNPENKHLKLDLTAKEIMLKQDKEQWTQYLKQAVGEEIKNAAKAEANGKLDEYIFLTGKNKTIKRYKDAMDVYNKNGKTMPEECWVEILKG